MRLDYAAINPKAISHLAGTRQHLSALPQPLLVLAELRASQLNGCAYCLSLHGPEARRAGFSAAQLDILPAWREAPGFDERTRAVLAWTEALTHITNGQAPDDVYAQAREVLSDAELVDLTLAVATINALNRVAISLRQHP
ncbi:carboxymuconolactone decarboxylase family protein [Isoalcanivorax indicus]|uniref:carboxymuconolactone decarboxylase family protein n=1 Tax=Isoalcanivorax indicus TaxID=2202653 RepID=UPI000DB928BC|nr:carboxymuconolactone decarboxylase family protein [Isoalcanivorax indicus]